MLKFERTQWQNQQDLFSKVCANELTGFVLENAMTGEQIDTVKRVIEENKTVFYTDLNNGNGFSLPGMFGQLHKTQPADQVDSYFRNIQPFCQAVDRSCGFTLSIWLEKTLGAVIDPNRLSVLPSFLPYSFRIVHPNKGGLNIHKDEDLLPYIHDSVSGEIERYIEPGSMMSWFFTIQAPGSGGELWVADSDYRSYQKKGQYELISPDGQIIPESAIDHLKVQTPTGSLLIFRGGSYWHQVLPPSPDSNDRITFGGFFAQSKQDENLYYYWS